jgi:hypothetical protein
MNEFETVRVVVELLVTALATILFWNFRSLKIELREEVIAREGVNRDLQEHKLHVAETYATNTDLRGFIEAVFKKLDRIEDKIDQKADK